MGAVRTRPVSTSTYLRWAIRTENTVLALRGKDLARSATGLENDIGAPLDENCPKPHWDRQT